MFEVVAVAAQGVLMYLVRQVIKQGNCMMVCCKGSMCDCNLRRLMKRRNSDTKMVAETSEESR
jgi:DNA topoisomerase VI subunit A